MIYIYDIECFNNYFCVTFKNVEKQTVKTYTIYHSLQNEFNCINELTQLHSFIQINKNKWLVGYNNKYFDNQIINYIYRNFEIFSILKTEYLTKEIYDFMTGILNNDKTEYKYNLPFQSVDLMPVGNVQQKSLKLVAVNLNWPLIQDLPIPYDSAVKDEDLGTIYGYNLNDVLITEQLYYKLSKDINVRWEVGQKYGLDLMSEPDSGMANRIMEKMYSEASNIPIKDLREMRTERKIIHYENIVFPSIHFQTPQLQEFLKEIRSQKWFKSQPFFSKSVIFGGVKYKLGIGGIHSDDKPGKFTKNTSLQQTIIDCDIASMYPKLMVNNNLYPAHLSKLFLTLYENIIKQRLEAKKAGRDTEAYVLKILVNSVFGKTLFEHHWLYDPLVGLRITVNGQLYMLMLIERLVLEHLSVISANTDGLVTIVPNDKLELYYSICNTWMNDTKFELEFTEYDKYVRRDVNNYITIKTNGKVKEKGEFLQFDEISLKQGIDKPIVSKALYNLFVNNIPVETTIYDEQDIYSFCTAKKTDNKFTNEFHTLENGLHNIQELQKTVRFYVSTDGGTLYKVQKYIEPEMKNVWIGYGDVNPKAGQTGTKYISYCVNRKVSILNDNRNTKDIKNYNIDYGYYIKEVNKIVDEIINPQLKLF